MQEGIGICHSICEYLLNLKVSFSLYLLYNNNPSLNALQGRMNLAKHLSRFWVGIITNTGCLLEGCKA